MGILGIIVELIVVLGAIQYAYKAIGGAFVLYNIDKILAAGECETCEEYIKEKYGEDIKVYITDKQFGDKIAFISPKGIFVMRALLELGDEEVLHAILDHEMEHKKSNDIMKISWTKIIAYTITAVVFIKYGLWGIVAGIATMLPIEIYEGYKERKMVYELKKNNPEVFEKLKLYFG